MFISSGASSAAPTFDLEPCNYCERQRGLDLPGPTFRPLLRVRARSAPLDIGFGNRHCSPAQSRCSACSATWLRWSTIGPICHRRSGGLDRAGGQHPTERVRQALSRRVRIRLLHAAPARPRGRLVGHSHLRLGRFSSKSLIAEKVTSFERAGFGDQCGRFVRRPCGIRV